MCVYIYIYNNTATNDSTHLNTCSVCVYIYIYVDNDIIIC